MRSMCVGVAETGGIDTYAEHVCRRRRDRVSGRDSNMCADGMESVFFILAVGYTWILCCSGLRLLRWSEKFHSMKAHFSAPF